MADHAAAHVDVAHAVHDPNIGNTGVDAFIRARKDAENSSEILRLALEREIERFSLRYGIEAHEAQILLLNTGVRL